MLRAWLGAARVRRNVQRAVKRPGPTDDATSELKGDRVGLTDPFDAGQSYANWWWGLTPSAMGAMLEASGFSVEKTQTNGFHTRIVARLRS